MTGTPVEVPEPRTVICNWGERTEDTVKLYRTYLTQFPRISSVCRLTFFLDFTDRTNGFV